MLQEGINYGHDRCQFQLWSKLVDFYTRKFPPHVCSGFELKEKKKKSPTIDLPAAEIAIPRDVSHRSCTKPLPSNFTHKNTIRSKNSTNQPQRENVSSQFYNFNFIWYAVTWRKLHYCSSIQISCQPNEFLKIFISKLLLPRCQDIIVSRMLRVASSFGKRYCGIA